MRRIWYVAFVMLFVAIMTLPYTVAIAQSTTHSYDFEMYYRVVDGWRNNERFYLPKGNAVISGSTCCYKQDFSANPKPFSPAYSLQKPGFLGIIADVSTVRGPANGSFTGSFGSIDAGTYALCIWIREEDHWVHSGSGKIRVN